MINANAAALNRRYRREKRFVIATIVCIICAILFLGGLLISVIAQGWRGFLYSSAQIEIIVDSAVIGDDGKKSPLSYKRLIKKSLKKEFPNIADRRDKKHRDNIISNKGSLILRRMVVNNPQLIGQKITVWLPAGSIAESYFKGAADSQELQARKISQQHIKRLDKLKRDNRVKTNFNTDFFIAADSRNAEMAGIGGALLGSFYTLLLAFLIAFPCGVLAAVYLELFAPRNRLIDLAEININNLAAVPSVIFGLLGLAIFINIFHLPRSSSLVGGLVLSLMTLPTIIIASRAAIKSVPSSLLPAALSLGATRIQGVFHHVLPAAMPGILTGAIIGMAQALGETAPLLMIGMIAFIADAPASITDAATALPVQIFLWADSPERGFAERAATAIIVLVGFLIIMNATAVILRKRFEIKW